MKLRVASLILLGLTTSASAQLSQPCVGVGLSTTALFQNVSCNMESLQPTYSATSQALSIASNATDVACITGATGKVIRIKKIRISGVAGAATNSTVYITKHAALNTGGTPATGTAIPVAYPNDSAFAAASATLQAWTANPTIVDSTPGIVAAQTMFFPASGTAAALSPAPFTWGDLGVASPLVLRSAVQQVCVNFNGATSAISSGAIEFVWTELTQ